VVVEFPGIRQVTQTPVTESKWNCQAGPSQKKDRTCKILQGRGAGNGMLSREWKPSRDLATHELLELEEPIERRTTLGGSEEILSHNSVEMKGSI